MTTSVPPSRTPRRKARELAKHLRGERPDYAYLKQVFRYLRDELEIEVDRTPQKLPHVPTEQEIRAFYETVWNARRATDVVMIKTLLYTGVRVSELVRIRTADVDLDSCRIRINRRAGRIQPSDHELPGLRHWPAPRLSRTSGRLCRGTTGWHDPSRIAVRGGSYVKPDVVG